MKNESVPAFALGLILLATSLLMTGRPLAMQDLHVVALFKDQALVVIDGKRRMLKTGETSPEGFKLVSADATSAVFDYQGRQLERRLDGRTGSTRAAVIPEYRVYRDASGMFRSVGTINGLTVDFLVDTGASAVAMNANQARRLGVDYLVEGSSAWVSTASDVLRAYKVKLDTVTLGPLQLHNVDAIVLEGGQPSEVLLGMSFLGRLEMINEGGDLRLKKRY